MLNSYESLTFNNSPAEFQQPNKVWHREKVTVVRKHPEHCTQTHLSVSECLRRSVSIGKFCKYADLGNVCYPSSQEMLLDRAALNSARLRGCQRLASFLAYREYTFNLLPDSRMSYKQDRLIILANC